MRLSWLSSTGIALTLLFATAAFAQHSSGGSSGGGGGSASSGGSHGGGGGGSGSSGGSHAGGGSSSSGGSHGSSGGSSSGSGGHSSSHGSTGSSSSNSHSHVSASNSNSIRSTERNSHTNNLRALQEGHHSPLARPAQPEKRGFFSFLRHAFRKAEPKPEPRPVADLRRKICIKGPCQVCPSGLAAGRSGCAIHFEPNRQDLCSHWGLTSTSACWRQSDYFDDCGAERAAMEQQSRVALAAEQARWNACNAGQTAECSDLATKSESESSYYRALRNRYQQCRQLSGGRYPFANFTFRDHVSEQAFDPFTFEFELR